MQLWQLTKDKAIPCGAEPLPRCHASGIIFGEPTRRITVADSSTSPASSEPPPTGRIASATRELTTFGRFIASLTPASLQSVSLVTMTCFMIALTGWVVWKNQTNQTDRENQLARYADSRDEVIRNHCDSREEKMRQWYAAERDKDRQYYQQAEEKWRVNFTAIQDEWRKWRELLAPFLRQIPKDECILLEPNDFIAPMPHAKAP